MANSIPMTTKEAIRALKKRGYSKRKIARELGIHRNTVGKYLKESSEPSSISEAAEDSDGASKCTISTTGSEVDLGPDESISSRSQSPQSSREVGRQSYCEPFREIIVAKLEGQLHAARIWQDLVDEHAFEHSYESVKRFVAKLKARDPKRVWRMECEPGEEAQVDYATAWVNLAGKRKKIHLLRVTLSHSRKGYTEAMPRQDTESFIRGIENAFRHLGGVPRMLVLDYVPGNIIELMCPQPLCSQTKKNA